MTKILSDILTNTNYIDYIGLLNQNVSSISYDSRKSTTNSCFVAIAGNNFDGHQFINQAIINGATTIICQKYPEKDLITSNITFILVEDTRRALATISHSFFDSPTKKLKVIGITGTNGKTTTTYIIKSIIESSGQKVGIIGTTGIYFENQKIETKLTTPESSDLAQIFYNMLQYGIEYVVMEVSSVAIIMNRVDCISFAAAAFSNLTQDHLDIHINMENYAKAKKILFDNLSQDSIAVVNHDDQYAEFMLQDCKANTIRRVGRLPNTDYKIIKETSNDKGNTFLLYGKYGIIDVVSKLSGTFNVDNCALAAVICQSLNIPLSAIQKGLSITEGAPGRMQKVLINNNAIAYIDYAHTPDALQKCLHTIKEFAHNLSSRIICVFGCGGDRDSSKRPLMGAIANQYADIIILTNDNPRTENPKNIINDILKGIDNPHKALIIEDRKIAIQKAVQLSSSQDIILIAGKGHENYQIIGKEISHFDDYEEICKYK